MKLRDVEPGDLDLYYRVRCDPLMMAELGGPLPRDGLEEQFRREVSRMQSGLWWVLTILADDSDPGSVAGAVSLWPRENSPTRTTLGPQSDSPQSESPQAEIGWMVLPEYQGRGLGQAAARAVLERARQDGRWGTVHATPSLTNIPSNQICRSLGFTLAGEVEIDYAGRKLRCNDWQIDPVDPPTAGRARLRSEGTLSS